MKNDPEKQQNRSGKNNSVHEKSAIALIGRYVTLLRASQHPNLQEYINNYHGSDKDEFTEDLYFATFLEEVFNKARKKLSRALTTESIRRSERLMYQKVNEIRKERNETTTKR